MIRQDAMRILELNRQVNAMRILELNRQVKALEVEEARVAANCSSFASA